MPNPQTKTELLESVSLVAILGGLLLFGLRLPGIWGSAAFDIAVFWEAGERMRAGGADLYLPALDPFSTGAYVYPPAFAGFFAPLTLLGRPAGYAVWALLQVAVLPVGLLLAARLCGVEREHLRRFSLVLLLALLGPAWVHLLQGQVNLFVVACVMLGLILIERDRPLLGGGWVGLAVQLKILPIVLVAVFAAQRRWKAVGGVALGLLLAHGSVLVWTIANHGPVEGVARAASVGGEFVGRALGPRVQSQDARSMGGASVPNNSTSAVAKRLFEPGHTLSSDPTQTSPLVVALPSRLVRVLGFSVALLLFALSVWLAQQRRDERQARVAAAGLALLAASLGNLTLWSHHLTFVILPLAPLVALRRWRHLAVAIGAFSLLTVPSMFDGLRHSGGLVDRLAAWGVPTLGVIVLWCVVFAAFTTHRPAPAEPASSDPDSPPELASTA